MKTKIETILFISAKPLSFKKIAEILAVDENAVREVVEELQMEYNRDKRGIRIVLTDKEAEMASAPENSEIAEKLWKGEVQGDLSQAALEVLAIILHKGQTSKLEIEEIRGVNCSITLRNLLIRGLITKQKNKDGQIIFKVSLELLKILGMEIIS